MLPVIPFDLDNPKMCESFILWISQAYNHLFVEEIAISYQTRIVEEIAISYQTRRSI
jgi:hypothetical protein